MNSIMDSIAGGLSVIKAPIIIPFAPRYSGKTCLLYRLIYFIRNYGFQVELATWFVSSHSIWGQMHVTNTWSLLVMVILHLQQQSLY